LLKIGIADYDYAEVLDGLAPAEIVSLEDQGNKGPSAGPGHPAKTGEVARAGARANRAGNSTNTLTRGQIAKVVTSVAGATNSGTTNR
jgi:hypothetical protein